MWSRGRWRDQPLFYTAIDPPMKALHLLTTAPQFAPLASLGFAGREGLRCAPRSVAFEHSAVLLEDTLSVWSGEFGCTHESEGVGKPGRDHNWCGFSMWLAGAGGMGGFSHDRPDDFGSRAVEERGRIYNLDATIPHLLGLDHEKLAHHCSGRDSRLANVQNCAVKEVLFE